MKHTQAQISTKDSRKFDADRKADKADRLAVKIVTLVSKRISKDGKLYAYDGIEAAREIRQLILDEMP